MKELKLAKDNEFLSFKGIYNITFEVLYGDVSLKVRKSDKSGTSGFGSSDFKAVQTHLFGDGMEVADESWISFFAQQERGALKKIKNIPEEYLKIIETPALLNAFKKYGKDSKQFKAVQKLYED